MLALVPSLTSIALLDSLSIIPLCIVFLAVLLAGQRPIFRSFALILGIFVVYFAVGALLLLGLQEVFDDINAYAMRLWQSPYTEELIAQIVIGALLVAVGWYLAVRRVRRAQEAVGSAMTAPQAWLAGAGLTIVGLPGAVPYVAAIDLALRTDLPSAERLLLIAYYNIMFVLPLAAIVCLRLVVGVRADPMIDAIRRFLDRWGPKLIVGLMLVLGVVLVVDGIGWFLGHPLIPI